MSTFTRIFFFIITLTIVSCWQKPPVDMLRLPESVNYTVVSRSPLFNKKNTTLSIDTCNNRMIITLDLNQIKDFPFPINGKDKDTLFNTAFNFDFYYNNKLITTDYKKNQNTIRWQIDSSKTANDLTFSSDTVNMNTENQFIYEIPFYAFHNLKKGKQSIELRIWQNTFKGSAHEIKTKGNTCNYCNYSTKCFLDAKVRFDLNIPAIYKSTVYGYGLQLKNDSTFSPAGMDNTLWNSSYPDIYWTLYYPTDQLYAQTPYQKSTDAYTDSDTFDLYHYYLNDSLGIGVFDHDYLSRDDGLGYWTGPMNFLRKEPRRRFSFSNIKWFDIKVGKAKLIN